MSTTIPPTVTGTPTLDATVVPALYEELCRALGDSDKAGSVEDHEFYAGTLYGLDYALKALGLKVDWHTDDEPTSS